MGQRRDAGTRGAEQTVRDIRRATRRKFSAEEKIRKSQYRSITENAGLVVLRYHPFCGDSLPL
jgi:hypothetical protein